MLTSMGRSRSTFRSARSATSPATSCAASPTCTTTASATATSRGVTASAFTASCARATTSRRPHAGRALRLPPRPGRLAQTGGHARAGHLRGRPRRLRDRLQVRDRRAPTSTSSSRTAAGSAWTRRCPTAGSPSTTATGWAPTSWQGGTANQALPVRPAPGGRPPRPRKGCQRRRRRRPVPRPRRGRGVRLQQPLLAPLGPLRLGPGHRRRQRTRPGDPVPGGRAGRAADAARDWRHQRRRRRPCCSSPTTPPVESLLELTGGGTIAAIRVNADVIHSFIGDLSIAVVSPPDPRVLRDRAGAGADDLPRAWTPAATPAMSDLVGRPFADRWTLLLTDHAGRDDWRLKPLASRGRPCAKRGRGRRHRAGRRRGDPAPKLGHPQHPHGHGSRRPGPKPR